MSRTRLDFHALLKQVTGYTNVYYQPPSRMSYPCILYEKASYDIKHADNIKYKSMTRYTVTVIGTNPDNDSVIDALLSIKYSSYDRRYKTSENLYHDVLAIYY